MEARADDIRADARLEAAGQRLARSHEVTIGTVEDMQAGTGLVLELDRLKRGAEKGRPTPNEAERMAAMRAQVETRSDALDETIRDAPEILREQLGLIDALGDGMRATRRAFEVGLATRAEPKEAEREHAVAVASVGLVVKGGSDSVRDVLRGPEGGGRGPGGTPGTPETALGGIARRGGEVAADTDEMRGRADGPNPRAPPEEGRRVTPSGLRPAPAHASRAMSTAGTRWARSWRMLEGTFDLSPDRTRSGGAIASRKGDRGTDAHPVRRGASTAFGGP